jgi:hypothetical protein
VSGSEQTVLSSNVRHGERQEIFDLTDNALQERRIRNVRDIRDLTDADSNAPIPVTWTVQIKQWQAKSVKLAPAMPDVGDAHCRTPT